MASHDRSYYWGRKGERGAGTIETSVLCLRFFVIHKRIMNMRETVAPNNLNDTIIIIMTYVCVCIDLKQTVSIKCVLFNLEEQVVL